MFIAVVFFSIFFLFPAHYLHPNLQEQDPIAVFSFSESAYLMFDSRTNEYAISTAFELDFFMSPGR
jgi:hypothetical protein